MSVVAKTSLAVVGLVAMANGQEPNAEWALGQMRGTSVVFGSCVDSIVGMQAIFSDEDCPERSFIEDEGTDDETLYETKWHNAYPDLASLEADIAANADATSHWVALAADVTLNQLEAALPADSKLEDYLFAKESTWALVTGITADAANALDQVQFSMPLTPKMKMSPLLPYKEVAAVDLSAGQDAEALAAKWSAAEVNGRSGPSTVAFQPTLGRVTVASKVEAEFLAAQKEIRWVGPAPRFELVNEDAAAILQSGYEAVAEDGSLADKMSVWARGITGEGQIVGVADSGLEVEHCLFTDDYDTDVANRDARLGVNETDFRYDDHRKVIQYYAHSDGVEFSVGGHGTHVVGTVAGKPLAGGDLANQGLAPDAKIAFFDVGKYDVARYVFPPNDAEKLVGPSKAAGAFLHTNSWGDSLGEYEESTRSLDKYLFENQDFAVLFSAGNSGSNGFNTVGFPALAKNVITVGASQNSERSFSKITYPCKNSGAGQCADSLAFFSSRGPAPDGRIKPDVVAPGFFILSAESTNENATFVEPTCEVSYKAGTSMSCPATAGTSALVRQFYTDGYFVAGVEDKANGIKPMGALIKASLVHSSETLGGFAGMLPRESLEGAVRLDDKIDVHEGFGRPMLERLMGADAASYKAPLIVGDFDNMEMLADGEEFTVNVAGIPGEEQLRVTMAYYDRPASVSSVTQMVNNLDLTVTSPSGVVYFPNDLDKADELNTVEQITIKPEDVEEGDYKITISAKVRYGASQPFALLAGMQLAATSTIAPTSAPTLPTANPTASPQVAVPTASPTANPTASPQEAVPTSGPTSSPSATPEPLPMANNGLAAGIVVGALAVFAAGWFAMRRLSAEKSSIDEEDQVATKMDI